MCREAGWDVERIYVHDILYDVVSLKFSLDFCEYAKQLTRRGQDFSIFDFLIGTSLISSWKETKMQQQAFF